MSAENTFAISYGKMSVPVYRVYARPLEGITPVPESSFRGRSNHLFACEIDVEVSGENFLPSYTQGDNSNVVATDSMKNFVLQQALSFQGSTLEEFLDLLGRRFLSTYAQMERLRISGREIPFRTVQVAGAGHDSGDAGSHLSDVLYSRSHEDYAQATLSFERSEGEPMLTAHRCGRVGMELFKITGSAFTHFIRDEFTTLEERVDRPLFIFTNVYWRYRDVEALLSSEHTRYVAAEQMRDIVQTVFDEFVSESIQHLVHEIGNRMLVRFPQLAEVSFEAQNRTRDLIVAAQDNEKVKVYSDPFSAYGLIQLTISRNS